MQVHTFQPSKIRSSYLQRIAETFFQLCHKPHGFLLSFRFACLHILITLSNVVLWSLPSSSKSAFSMSSAIPNTYGMSVKSSSILFQNMSSTGATQNSNCIYLYQPNVQENAVKYDDNLSYFRL